MRICPSDVGHEVPDPALEHDAERPEVAGDRHALAPVLDPQRLPLPDRLGDGPEVRHRLAGLEPAGGIEMEPLHEPRGARAELRAAGPRAP